MPREVQRAEFSHLTEKLWWKTYSRGKAFLDYKMGRQGVRECKETKKILLNIHLKNKGYLTIWTGVRTPLLPLKAWESIKYPYPKRSSRWSKKLTVRMMMNLKSWVQSRARTWISTANSASYVYFIAHSFICISVEKYGNYIKFSKN